MIDVPSSVIKNECKELDFPKLKCLLRNDFTTKSFDCSEENGLKCLNFPNVLINSQYNLSILNIHQNRQRKTQDLHGFA